MKKTRWSGRPGAPFVLVAYSPPPHSCAYQYAFVVFYMPRSARAYVRQ